MSQALVRVAIAGGLGRMGRATQAVLAERSDTILVGRFDRPGAPLADGLVCEADAIAASDVVVDFTTPGGSVALARRCAEAGRPALVIGSTGFSEADEAAFRSLSTRLTIVKAGNFSLGVNMLLGLVRQAAALLPSSAYDIEIVEAHHRRKVDAPSGTALMLGEAAADGRGVDLSAVAVRGRDGEVGPRSAGAIGFAVVRGGGIVGEHAVSFAAEDEILTLSHSARDRSLFARGAVEAAVWAATRPPGLYDMQDVLGFSRPVR